MSGRNRSRNNSTYKTYKYEALQPLLNNAYNAATTRYRYVNDAMRPLIEDHMYDTITAILLKGKSSYTNDDIKPALSKFLNAKYANYKAYQNSLKNRNHAAKVYKNMVHTGLLKKEINRATKNPRGGATRRRNRA
jgi:hypothetical protein